MSMTGVRIPGREEKFSSANMTRHPPTIENKSKFTEIKRIDINPLQPKNSAPIFFQFQF